MGQGKYNNAENLTILTDYPFKNVAFIVNDMEVKSQHFSVQNFKVFLLSDCSSSHWCLVIAAAVNAMVIPLVNIIFVFMG